MFDRIGYGTFLEKKRHQLELLFCYSLDSPVSLKCSCDPWSLLTRISGLRTTKDLLYYDIIIRACNQIYFCGYKSPLLTLTPTNCYDKHMFLRVLSVILSLFFTFGSSALAHSLPADFFVVVGDTQDSLVDLNLVPFPELELPPDS